MGESEAWKEEKMWSQGVNKCMDLWLSSLLGRKFPPHFGLYLSFYATQKLIFKINTGNLGQPIGQMGTVCHSQNPGEPDQLNDTACLAALMPNTFEVLKLLTRNSWSSCHNNGCICHLFLLYTSIRLQGTTMLTYCMTGSQSFSCHKPLRDSC